MIPFAQKMGMSEKRVMDIEAVLKKEEDDDGDVRLMFTPENFDKFDTDLGALVFTQPCEEIKALLRPRERPSPLSFI